MMMINDSGENS